MQQCHVARRFHRHFSGNVQGLDLTHIWARRALVEAGQGMRGCERKITFGFQGLEHVGSICQLAL